MDKKFINKDYVNLMWGLNPKINALNALKKLGNPFASINSGFDQEAVNNFNPDVGLTESSQSEPLKEKFREPIVSTKKDLLNKYRRRSIKNNKIVFVHDPKKKQLNQVKVEEEEYNEEEFLEDESNDNKEAYVEDSNEDTGLLPNGKKPRGSRYRGVSRNGNLWQVRCY
jgi:hypothetical protein